VVCELAGKDHFTVGGSRSVAVAISDEVLGYPPPFPSTPKNIGQGYEFFTVGGKKMSTSKGEGMGFAEITDYLPAKMIRYLLVRTRPRARVDFDPMDDNDIILLYDRYDRTQRVYHGAEEVGDKEREQEKRIYEFSAVGDIEKRLPPQIPLTYASTVVQVTPDLSRAVKILQTTGHLPAELSKPEMDYLKERLGFARQWVDKLASDRYKFRLLEKSDVKVEPDVKKVMRLLGKKLLERNWKEDELLNTIYGMCRENGLDTKKFFRSTYNVLIGKDYGPRLAPFILTIGREKVAKALSGV